MGTASSYGDRDSGCTRKRYHATLKSAKRAAKRTGKAKGHGLNSQNLQAYHCRHCGGYHVGRRRNVSETHPESDRKESQ
jgi:hypothetical protein